MPRRSSTDSPAAANGGKHLVIAEKPSVARDISRVLGGFRDCKEYFESDKFVVCSAVGHLLELAAPEGAEVKRGKWSLHNLPVMPDHFDLRPIAKNESRLKLLKRLYKRDDVRGVINACDAGREGELIFHHIMRHFKAAKPVRRLWLQSMTPQSIRAGFDQLREGGELLPLQRAAVCRSESDWLVGINATRAMTALNSVGGGFSLTTVGRVQTPTLAILVDREKLIKNFTPKNYWEVRAAFSVAAGEYEGRWVDPQFTKGEGGEDARAERIWDGQKAAAVVARCSGKKAVVSDTKKLQTMSPPMLFHLTSLQREANKRFGFSARATLAIAQALYERHKVLTYPRTDSRALPEDYPPTVKKILAGIAAGAAAPKKITAGKGEGEGEDESRGKSEPPEAPLAGFAQEALDKNYVNSGNKRIFNNQKISDHFAIIPTGEAPKTLREQEWRIYNLVARSFVAAFFPGAKFEVTERRSVVDADTFETKGRILVEPGWLQVAGRKEGGETLPAVAEGERAAVREVEAEAKTTRPPPRYSEATLLSAMEGAGKFVEDEELREAMSGRGLGTPATRAAIIEDLIRNRYVLRDMRELVPTPKATSLLRLLHALKIDELTAPELTGEWEKKLKQIESDKFAPEQFMGHIRDMTERIVDAARKCDVDNIAGEYAVLDAPCPKCGGTVRENYRKFACANAACGFSQWKSVAGRELAPPEMSQLLRDKEIGPLDGFRSRLGREFSAGLVLKDDFTVVFDFADEAGGDVDLSECETIGRCPKCNAWVHAAPRKFTCARATGDQPLCDFTLARQILRRDLETHEARQLLANRKTELLQNFTSKRTKRKFAAHLTLDDAGKLGFEFGERKGKRAAA
ncbi:MAG: DNA topoisomerase III [Gammaproteobacteria bacterium]|nr:DNA topoisomerase III [Gammaproteobacteria bacterium]